MSRQIFALAAFATMTLPNISFGQQFYDGFYGDMAANFSLEAANKSFALADSMSGDPFAGYYNYGAELSSLANNVVFTGADNGRLYDDYFDVYFQGGVNYHNTAWRWYGFIIWNLGQDSPEARDALFCHLLAEFYCDQVLKSATESPR